MEDSVLGGQEGYVVVQIRIELLSPIVAEHVTCSVSSELFMMSVVGGKGKIHYF